MTIKWQVIIINFISHNDLVCDSFDFLCNNFNLYQFLNLMLIQDNLNLSHN